MKGFQCDNIFAFVAVDELGNEGIVMAEYKDNSMPLVAADLEKVKVLIPLAEYIAQSNGINISLCHYQRIGEVNREFIEQFVGVRLTGEPGGDGVIAVDGDDSGDDEPEPDGTGRPH